MGGGEKEALKTNGLNFFVTLLTKELSIFSLSLSMYGRWGTCRTPGDVYLYVSAG